MTRLTHFAGNGVPAVYAFIFLLIFALLFPPKSLAMNTYRVGEIVVGESYNELMKTWNKHNFSLWVGIADSGEEYVLFSGDTGIGEVTVAMPYTAERVGTIERLLVTAQEWVNISKKGRADTDKVLGCFQGIHLPCERGGMPHVENLMGLRFYASNEGQESSLIIYLFDQSNSFKRATIHLGPSEIGALIKNLRQLASALDKARETASKQHLFKKP